MRLKIEPSAHTPAETLVGESAPAAAYSADLRALVADGVAAAQSGDRARARVLLTQATDKDPSNADAWMWLASISEYPEELLVFLNKALECDPANQRAIDWHASTCSLIAKNFVHRGVAAKDEGNHALAMDCFEKAIENDPNSEMAWFWKASIAPDESVVVESLNRVLEINPENDDARVALSSIDEERIEKRFLAVQRTVAAGNWYEALNELDEFLADNLASVEAWTLRSHISSSIEEKLLCYERILSLEPSNQFASAGRDFLTALNAAVAPEVVEQPAAAEDLSVAEEESAEANAEAIAMPTDTPLENAVPQLTGNETILDPPYFGEEARVEPAPEYLPDSEPEVDPMIVAAALAELEANDKADILEPIDEVEPHFNGEIHVSDDPVPATEDLDQHDELSSVPYGSPFNDRVEERRVDQPEEPLFNDDDTILESTMIDFAPEAEASDDVNDFLKAYDDRFHAEPAAEPTAEEIAAEAAIHETVGAPMISSVPEFECPFCAAEVAPQAFSCKDCRAILSLDDIEAVLASTTGDLEQIHDAVVEMEASLNSREFTARELTDLGMGHLNLKNFDRGLRYLQEAVRLNPDDLILVSQVNSLAIRLDEIHRHDASANQKAKGCSILVVDDSATVRKLISNKLEKHGHTVICASDGVEAMDAIDNFTPELVLLDITMPRMDGYQVCKMIRAHETAKDVPVVMISGKDGFFDKVRGKMSGCTGYITKPFGPETLMKALDTYLTQPQQPVVE
ncbi:MAG: response regulator [Acidobacteria bacterium]|nr:response regulator [Acidobacteriota bacterium]